MVQEPLGNTSSPVSPSWEASGAPAMPAEALVLELREAPEWVKTNPSGEQAAAPPLSSSTSLPPVFAKNMMMELRRSADLLQG